MQKVQSGKKPFYPNQYGYMERKATDGLGKMVNGKNKDQHFSVQFRYKCKQTVVRVIWSGVVQMQCVRQPKQDSMYQCLILNVVRYNTSLDDDCSRHWVKVERICCLHINHCQHPNRHFCPGVITVRGLYEA